VRVLDGYTGKVQVQSLTQVLPAWWNWRVVRAGGVGTGGMGKRGRAEDKGKAGGDLIGIIFRFFGLKIAKGRY
jgi:hypothetical protein